MFCYGLFCFASWCVEKIIASATAQTAVWKRNIYFADIYSLDIVFARLYRLALINVIESCKVTSNILTSVLLSWMLSPK